MTILTPRRARSSGTDRLLQGNMSPASCQDSFSAHEDVNKMEEKKIMDEGDILSFQRESVISNKRPASSDKWRNMISKEPESKFLPQKGRYTLYVSRACPSSHYIMMMHSLKGLKDTVSIVTVTPHPDDHLQRRWMISNELLGDGSSASLKSDEGEFKSIRDIYEKEEHDHSNCNNSSIPLLYDKQHECIVNNNTGDIATMLNTCFNENGLCQNPALNLLSANDTTNNAVVKWLSPLMQLTPSMFPPYRYDVSPRELEFAFHRATVILQRQRYLTSHSFVTEADLRLFCTLIRYEEVYSKFLQQPPELMHNSVLMDYCRDIYQMEGVKETVNMKEIRTHFLGHHSFGGSSSVTESLLEKPHKRHLL